MVLFSRRQDRVARVESGQSEFFSDFLFFFNLTRPLRDAVVIGYIEINKCIGNDKIPDYIVILKSK